MILAPNLCFRTIPTTCTTVKHQKEPHQLKPVTQTKTKVCECFDLHNELIPYRKAWCWQKQIVKQKKALVQEHEDCPDTLIVLQHNPVYTMGTGSSEKYLNFDMKEAPFDVYRTERGGEVTYHGPGQLVMYPIINLRNHKMDLHWYLRTLEEVVIRVLSSTFSIKASRIEGLTGVWVAIANIRLRVLAAWGRVRKPATMHFLCILAAWFRHAPALGNQKLAAIGVRVSQWITYHGLALNVTTDLTPFGWIVPCGLSDRQVGSIKGLLQESQLSTRCGEAAKPNPDDYQLIEISYKSLIKEFSDVFNLEIQQKAIPTPEFWREDH